MKIVQAVVRLFVVFCVSSALTEAAIPGDLKFKTFYDTTKTRFDKLMWFGEIPTKKGYFLVAEQNGKVWVLNAAASTKSLYMDFPTYSNMNYHEDGLLGFAFHPKFAQNRKIYAYYTPVDKRTDLAIGVMTADETFLKDSGGGVKEIWSSPISLKHNGSTLKFGPDGLLYWAVGQAHAAHGAAQDIKNPRGKMYRIDVDNTDPGKAYRVPLDNPYVNASNGAAKEIYAHGFRNPMKFDFDALTGDLWEVEVGQWLFEDVNIVKKGDNLGWDIMEGTNCFGWGDETHALATCNKTNLKEPVWAIPHIDPDDKWLNSGTGGMVYRANPQSKYYGTYLFGDFCSRQMFGLTQKEGKMTEIKEIGKAPLGPIHFALGSDGSIYMAGWYYSSTPVTGNGASQILMLDHPELKLGAVVNIIPAQNDRKSKMLAKASFVRLQGMPIGYRSATDEYGREIRSYSLDGARTGNSVQSSGVRFETAGAVR